MMTRWKTWRLAFLCAGALVIGVLCIPAVYRRTIHPVKLRLVGKSTVSDRLAQFGQAARGRLGTHFHAAGVNYPPTRVLLVALKQERRIELYAANAHAPLRYVTAYPILAASGRIGPKLRQGDYQVPEGVYDIESLNPNSAYHVALRVSYPNAFDRQMAQQDGRASQPDFDPGGDIMIHGKAVSIGCLAMGDRAAEELFTLAADAGESRVQVLIAPLDLRVRQVPAETLAPLPEWVPRLYDQLAGEMRMLPTRPNVIQP